jgi:hypothetical protein
MCEESAMLKKLTRLKHVESHAWQAFIRPKIVDRLNASSTPHKSEIDDHRTHHDGPLFERLVP